MKIVCAMVGSFGSGCSYIVDRMLVEKHGFYKVSLSEILRDELRRETGTASPSRDQLQQYGTKLRQRYGSGHLAERALGQIRQMADEKSVVVDSVRNPEELAVLRREFAAFYSIGVYATHETRWERVKEQYSGNQANFTKDDKIDKDEGVPYGQRVTDCFLEVDVVIDNNKQVTCLDSDDGRSLVNQISAFLDLVDEPGCRPPNDDESFMAMAYAVGQRSSCMKRKVGALIVDARRGSILSSGYNEIPGNPDIDSCTKKHGGCYRGHLKSRFHDNLLEAGRGFSEKDAKTIEDLLWPEFKILDRCRSLHAEEMSILNMVRSGSHIAEDAVIYVTTFPCNLCANKIVTVGINEVVYYEPYPVKESVEILGSAKVDSRPFTGVTFNGYFRLFRGGVSGA